MASLGLPLELGQGWRASATAPRRPARAVLEEAEEAGMLWGWSSTVSLVWLLTWLNDSGSWLWLNLEPYFCTGLTNRPSLTTPGPPAASAAASSSASNPSTNPGSQLFRPGFIRSAR